MPDQPSLRIVTRYGMPATRRAGLPLARAPGYLILGLNLVAYAFYLSRLDWRGAPVEAAGGGFMILGVARASFLILRDYSVRRSPITNWIWLCVMLAAALIYSAWIGVGPEAERLLGACTLVQIAGLRLAKP